jgi:hypothetical protein
MPAQVPIQRARAQLPFEHQDAACYDTAHYAPS